MLFSMSKVVTEDDMPVDYSSETDEFDSEPFPDMMIEAEPAELYIGNTGKLSPGAFYNMFKQHGVIVDMNIWRTHENLYHARVVYRKMVSAVRAIDQLDGKIYNGKRLRVSLAKDPVALDFNAAVRIEDISPYTTEEDIYDHFSSCGGIRFVVKTPNAAYVQFQSAQAAASALSYQSILNGDPYIIEKISLSDTVDHIHIIDSMKQVKYRKPFVMVENFPRFPRGTPLRQYKQEFLAVCPVRHFKIAPTDVHTVTLALCVDKMGHRDQLIKRFHNKKIGGRQLKLYLAPGKARMTTEHIAAFALPRSSVVVTGIPPYYRDYDVCKLFGKCGDISFLERVTDKWVICFEKAPAVSLASFYSFILNRNRLAVQPLTADTLPTLAELMQDSTETISSEEIIIDEGSLEDLAAARERELVEIDATEENGGSKPGDTSNGGDQPEVIDTIDLDDESPSPKQRPTNKKTTTSNEPVVAIVSEDSSKESVVELDEDTPAAVAPPVAARVSPVRNLKIPVAPSGRFTSQRSTADQPAQPKQEFESKGFAHKASIFLANLPKGIGEHDLCELFQGSPVRFVVLLAADDSYFPSATAYVSFHNVACAKKALIHNRDIYRHKRVLMMPSFSNQAFQPEMCVMLKNLTTAVNEEIIFDEIEKIMGDNTVLDVLRPAFHYAYVEFADADLAKEALMVLRQRLTRYKVDVFSFYQSIPKRLLWSIKPPSLQTVEEARAVFGLADPYSVDQRQKHFGPHNAHKLFVGNIPRDAKAEDIIEYFNVFGTVVDFKLIEHKSCYLRKSIVLTFADEKHAQTAYRVGNHYFEGAKLELHLMDGAPYEFVPGSKVITVKTHSPFLTTDEVQHELEQYVKVAYCLRFDAYDERANIVIRYDGFKPGTESVNRLAEIEFINGEAVLIVDGLDLEHPGPKEAPESKGISYSKCRKEKEKYLSYVLYSENLREELEVRTKRNDPFDVPFNAFYNNRSVQVNNVSLETKLEDLCNLFFKCGNIVDYRALVLEEDGTKICYLTFDLDLAADLACTYNQRMLHGRRLLIHLTKESIRLEQARSILIEGLQLGTTAEEIYSVFAVNNTIIKYVQKQSPYSAIVCFKEAESVSDAICVSQIGNSSNIAINPCYAEYDARFYHNFSVSEESVSVVELRHAQELRVMSELHHLRIERQVFDTFPYEDKLQLLQEVTQVRRQIVNFSSQTLAEQLHRIKSWLKPPHRDHFLKLNMHEQEKVLTISEALLQNAATGDSNLAELLPAPPPAKQSRLELGFTTNVAAPMSAANAKPPSLIAQLQQQRQQHFQQQPQQKPLQQQQQPPRSMMGGGLLPLPVQRTNEIDMFSRRGPPTMVPHPSSQGPMRSEFMPMRRLQSNQNSPMMAPGGGRMQQGMMPMMQRFR